MTLNLEKEFTQEVEAIENTWTFSLQVKLYCKKYFLPLICFSLCDSLNGIQSVSSGQIQG